MTCRYCGTEMTVRRTMVEAFDRKRRELRCPTCKRRCETVEKVVKFLAPVTIK